MFKTFLQRLQTPEGAPIWTLASAVMFCIALVVVFIAGQAFAVTLTGGNLINPAPSAIPLGIAIASVLNVIVVVRWVARRVQKGTVNEAIRLYPINQPPLFVVILMGLAGAYLIDLIGVLTGLKAGQTVPPAFGVLRDTSAIFAWAVAAIVIIVLQPMGEEITFRGLLYPAAAAQFGNPAGIGLSALAYTIFNLLVSGQGTAWYVVIQPLLMALWVGVIRAYTQSTRMAMVARAMFGLFYVLSALILR
jgi:membrane protease YdiL (CAAX protease family)